MEWEYKVIADDSSYLEKELNNLGLSGWELVNVCKSYYHTYCYLKRPKIDPNQKNEPISL